MKIRVILAGHQAPVYSQAIYHGIAQRMKPSDSPVLVLVRPIQPFISIGMHQNIDLEINQQWCIDNAIPIVRRSVGGGCVLLDKQQLFFQLIFPSQLLPNKPADIFRTLLQPIVDTYKTLGCKDVNLVDNDIQVHGKKICGTGAATIENTHVVVGNFIYQFDFSRMALCIRSPSENFSSCYAELMQEHMTTLERELNNVPEETKIIQQLCFHLQHHFDCQTEASELSEVENTAILAAIEELQDDDWLQSDNKKLINHGIKIAANTYLLEKQYTADLNINVRLLIRKDKIEKCWFEAEDNSENYLTKLATTFNHIKPHVTQYEELLADQPQLLACFRELLDFQPY